MVLVPLGATRVSAPAAISTRITEPSAQATGPSGNCSPSVTVQMSIADSAQAVAAGFIPAQYQA
jgi:hypothetical protein